MFKSTSSDREPKPVLRTLDISVKLSTICLIVLSCLVSACSPQVTPTPTAFAPVVTLRISGSGSVTSVLSAIQADFEAAIPNYRLEVLPGTGTGGGVEGIIEGLLDVAAMARPPREEEAAQDVQYYEIGLTGQALFAHPEVEVSELTSEQARAIFSGEITNWSEIGGQDLAIVLYVRDASDSSTNALREAIFGDTPFPESATIETSQSSMQTVVAGTPGAIGYGTWSAVVASGTEVQAMALDGIMPDNAEYPLLTPIGIGYLSDREADVQPLLDWLRSELGQTSLRRFAVLPSNG